MLVFWHGGGYVYPATDIHWKFLSRMASVHGWSVTAPLYPLAPENTADHITNWAMDYYAAYLADMGDTAFVMGGDSAGGGLTHSEIKLLGEITRHQTPPNRRSRPPNPSRISASFSGVKSGQSVGVNSYSA